MLVKFLFCGLFKKFILCAVQSAFDVPSLCACCLLSVFFIYYYFVLVVAILYFLSCGILCV